MKKRFVTFLPFVAALLLAACNQDPLFPDGPRGVYVLQRANNEPLPHTIWEDGNVRLVLLSGTLAFDGRGSVKLSSHEVKENIVSKSQDDQNITPWTTTYGITGDKIVISPCNGANFCLPRMVGTVDGAVLRLYGSEGINQVLYEYVQQ